MRMRWILAAIALGMSSPALAQYMQIGGTIMTSRGVPIPGCIVILLNPSIGQSYPISTGANGEYFFPQVPSQVATLYTIRVIWNGTIIYQGVVSHPGIQEPIRIPVP